MSDWVTLKTIQLEPGYFRITARLWVDNDAQDDLPCTYSMRLVEDGEVVETGKAGSNGMVGLRFYHDPVELSVQYQLDDCAGLPIAGEVLAIDHDDWIE